MRKGFGNMTAAERKTVLVAGVGTTPAVLTETVWGLAHQTPPVVPDEIVVLTTLTGRQKLEREVTAGEPSVWSRLVAALKAEGLPVDGMLAFGETSIRVFPDAHRNPLADLRSGDENLRAADFMLAQLRQYTESPDFVVLTSIAGGRKTMSALLLSCMTLLGRADDRVYHVLLPPEFEGRLDPPFYFPENGVMHRTSASPPCELESSKAAVELFEVPYVRMRGWYQEKFKSIPPSYETLVSKVQSVAPAAIVPPDIAIDAWQGALVLNGRAVPLSRPCFAALLLLADGCAVKDLHKRLCDLYAGKGGANCDWLSSFRESGGRFSDQKYAQDLTKVMSELRKKLKEAGFTDAESLVPMRGGPVVFPLSRIQWKNRKRLADVCGYPQTKEQP